MKHRKRLAETRDGEFILPIVNRKGFHSVKTVEVSGAGVLHVTQQQKSALTEELQTSSISLSIEDLMEMCHLAGLSVRKKTPAAV